MSAQLALIGGEEFSPGFEDVHSGLLAGLPGKKIVYLPTCAADDGDEAIDHWCGEAVKHFSALGAEIEAPRIVDRATADDPSHASLIAGADWIYIGGGFPHVAVRILPGTRVLAALQTARMRGALISGASGGAMLMGQQSHVMTPQLIADISRHWDSGAPPDWDPPMPEPLTCLGWVPNAICYPHFNRLYPASWLQRGYPPPGFSLIGLDEQTALVSLGEQWEVRGRGGVTIIRAGSPATRYAAGQKLTL